MMYKAMIIDDEEPVRIAVNKLADWKKYNVDEIYQAENGMEALKSMRELRPDIIFVDMNMPVLDGVRFLEKASKEFPDARFIVISGYDDFSYAQSAIRYGAVEYLLKPIDASELNRSIERAILSINPEETFEEKEENYTTAEDVILLIHRTIEERYSENIKISDFSDRYFFSREYISKLYKVKYGIGIYEDLSRIRMERACDLLKDQENQVRDIALRVGFSDTNYFSRAFRKYTGITPTEYRRSVTGGE
ncbi:MAG: response regulator [Lachnospiraceae bacterium]|nr:response regulator [Lachnospiraceae bacterium]